MGHRFAEIAFTPNVRKLQSSNGSRSNYAAMEGGEDFNNLLSEQEANFISARDSFYMASVGETGWPYVQHRGGPAGFMRVIDEQTIGFADFSGNRQYVSTGNFMNDDRVSLFFMDYPNKTRLKLLGRVRLVSADETELLSSLEVDDYRARVERGFVIHVEAFDWNCPQHITPRYTQSYIDNLIEPLLEENKQLKATKKELKDIDKDMPAVIGNGPLELVISGIRQLTPRVRTYELRDPDGGKLPMVEAGSHIQIPVNLDNGEITLRNYSICSNPARRDIYEISVLREDKGLGGSRAIHAHFYLGLTLRCELPKNHFELHKDQRPAVLIAGGIGITPIKAMAQALKARNNNLHLHYAGRNHKEMAFRDRLQLEFGEDITIYSAADSERLDLENVLSSAPDETIFYVCGPNRLIDAVSDTAAAINIDSTRINFERFSATIIKDAKPIQVELKRSGKQLYVSAKQSILDAMLEAGIDAPYSCRTGECKTCAVKVLKGKPIHQDSVLTDNEKEEQQLMCPCVSRAKTENLSLDI